MIAYDPYHEIDSCQVRGRNADGKSMRSRGRTSKEQREEDLRRHRQSIKPGVVAGARDPSSGEAEGSRPWRDFVSKDQVDCT